MPWWSGTAPGCPAQSTAPCKQWMEVVQVYELLLLHTVMRLWAARHGVQRTANSRCRWCSMTRPFPASTTPGSL